MGVEAGEKGLPLEDHFRWSMDVDEGEGSNGGQLSHSRLQFHHRGTRQAREDCAGPRTLRLNEGGGEALVAVSGGQRGEVRDRKYFLEEDKVRLAVSDEGMEAPQVCPLIGIEAEDREEEGDSLSILPRERRTAQSPVKAAWPLWKERKLSPPWEGRPCRRSGPWSVQGGGQLPGRPCHLLQTPSKSWRQTF